MKNVLTLALIIALVAVSLVYIGCQKDESLSSPTAPVTTDAPTVTALHKAQGDNNLTANLPASADTYVRRGAPNTNEGASPIMRLQAAGDNRALIRIDQGAITSLIGHGKLVSAALELEILENGNNWGKTGRVISAYRLTSDWAEGNGKNAEQKPRDSFRGTGIGATWNCAKDQNITNEKPDIADQQDDWEMRLKKNKPFEAPWVADASDGMFIQKTSQGVIDFDVTVDVAAFLSGTDNYGWIIRKAEENKAGYVSFNSRETGLTGPRLVVTYLPAYLVHYVAIGNTLPVTVPADEWVYSGDATTGTFPAGGTSGGTRDVFVSATPALPATITGPTTITGTYQTQYLVHYVATGNVLPVTVPADEWVNSGGATTGTFPAGGISGGTRDVFVSAAPALPATITAPTTITGTYKTQYQVHYVATGNALTVTVPADEWINSGGATTGTFPTLVTDGSGTQCVFVSAAPALPATITGPTTITGTYQTKYLLTLAITAGVPGGLSNISGGTNGTFYNTGTVLSLTATTPSQWQFANWTGGATGSTNQVSVTMNAPKSVTANYNLIPLPSQVVQSANQDTYIRGGYDNTNEGASPFLRVEADGDNGALVGFDLTGVNTNVQHAYLQLTILYNDNNWGGGSPGTRYVDAQRILAPWTEGNGVNNQDLTNAQLSQAGISFTANRGSGAGVTWNCPSDVNVNNSQPDGTQWQDLGLTPPNVNVNSHNVAQNGGAYATTQSGASVPHYNGMPVTVQWDVTQDVRAGVQYGWIVHHRDGVTANGQVHYYSKEGAAMAGNPALAPRLILNYGN